MKPNLLSLCRWAIVFAVLSCGLADAPAADPVIYVESFDSKRPSWFAHYDQTRVRLLSHKRDNRGAGFESFEFQTSRQGAFVRLEHPLPAARRIDDLKLELSLNSNRTGAYVALRVIFPHQIDPRTGKVLGTWIMGDAYTKPRVWQRLRCTVLQKQLRERIVLLRHQLRQSNLVTHGAYVDRAILGLPLSTGTSKISIDNLRFGPIVPVPKESTVVPADGEQESREGPVDFSQKRLRVAGRPFFPRFTAYHSEDVGELKRAHFNAIWIPDYQDETLMKQLIRYRMWAIATPPSAVSESGAILDAQSANVIPLPPATSPIIAWCVGTRIPPEAHHKLIDWSRQTRSADRLFSRPRPIMADVTGLEAIYSRHVEWLAVSRHANNTTFSYKNLRDWLLQKKKLAQPGSFMWTWIQTEPASATARWRRSARMSPVVIEPEQIRQQTYAALQVGYRGLGYWKTTPLGADDPGTLERRLIISQLNLEIELFEPWLAAGTPISNVAFSLSDPRLNRLRKRRYDANRRDRLRWKRDGLFGEDGAEMPAPLAGSQTRADLLATAIRSEYGVLVLLVMYGEHDQFVPGQLAARNATIVVPVFDETASAWAVTTTDIHSLKREPVAGGVRVKLDHFDQTAAILFTSDKKIIAQLRAKIERIAQPSASIALNLARAKLSRVRQVDEELTTLGHGQSEAPQLLSKATKTLNSAEAAYQGGDLQGYHRARQLSSEVMQYVRLLQRAHWNEAIQSLPAPISSPHTVCFQTLADHWRMIARIGRSPIRNGVNLLRSGDFEDKDTMVIAGWKHAQKDMDDISAGAELHPEAHSGSFSLRMWAIPKIGKKPPRVVSRPPVKIISPPIKVRSGQVIHISGWIRVVSGIAGSIDGVMFYDSLAGPSGALRWRQRTGWKRFVLVREVVRSGEFTLTAVLTGMGDVRFDDIRVVPHDPRSPSVYRQPTYRQPTDSKAKQNSRDQQNPKLGRFRFLERFPGLGGRKQRR